MFSGKSRERVPGRKYIFELQTMILSKLLVVALSRSVHGMGDATAGQLEAGDCSRSAGPSRRDHQSREETTLKLKMLARRGGHYCITVFPKYPRFHTFLCDMGKLSRYEDRQNAPPYLF